MARAYTKGNIRGIIIKKGDKFISKSRENATGDAIMTVVKVTSQNPDGYVYYKLNKKDFHGKKSGRARVWWFREYAVLIR